MADLWPLLFVLYPNDTPLRNRQRTWTPACLAAPPVGTIGGAPAPRREGWSGDAGRLFGSFSGDCGESLRGLRRSARREPAPDAAQRCAHRYTRALSPLRGAGLPVDLRGGAGHAGRGVPAPADLAGRSAPGVAPEADPG